MKRILVAIAVALTFVLAPAAALLAPVSAQSAEQPRAKAKAKAKAKKPAEHPLVKKFRQSVEANPGNTKDSAGNPIDPKKFVFELLDTSPDGSQVVVGVTHPKLPFRCAFGLDADGYVLLGCEPKDGAPETPKTPKVES